MNYSVLIVLALILGLAGCGKSSSSTPTKKPVAVSQPPAGSGGSTTNPPTNTPPGNGNGGGFPPNCNPPYCNPPVGGPPVYPPGSGYPPGGGPSHLEFRLKQGESESFSMGGKSYHLTVKKIEKPDEIQCVTTPCNQPVGYVVIKGKIGGGCGPDSPPDCVGIFPVTFRVKLTEANSIKNRGDLQFQLIRLRKNRARFVVAPL